MLDRLERYGEAMKLYRRGLVWYTDYYENGVRVQRSTRCTDKRAAQALATRWERDAADPDSARLRDATLSDVLTRLIKDRAERAKAGSGSHDTVKFYRVKAGHLKRVFELDAREQHVPMPLRDLKPRNVDDYISQRRGEGAADNTIHKELVTLRTALKLAKRAGLWRGDIDALMPDKFAPNYKPRSRFLTESELKKILPRLSADHAAAVAFMVGTSAEWGAVTRARREDVSIEKWRVFLRGTKRATRERVVPIVTDWQQGLVRYALEHAQGTDGMLFRPWDNVRRDLTGACDAAGLPSCSPNDLRRTCATWLREAGAAPDLIAAVLGHADSRMVERVYGRLPTDVLAHRLAVATGSLDLHTGATNRLETAALAGQLADPETKKAPPEARLSVPRDGIEPPTRGFSIPCSTN
jgi:integrase